MILTRYMVISGTETRLVSRRPRVTGTEFVIQINVALPKPEPISAVIDVELPEAPPLATTVEVIDSHPLCDADGCSALARWAHIGESGDFYVCDEHIGDELNLDGWSRMDREDD